jgi:hypothetical protein
VGEVLQGCGVGGACVAGCGEVGCDVVGLGGSFLHCLTNLCACCRMLPVTCCAPRGTRQVLRLSGRPVLLLVLVLLLVVRW